MKKTCKSKIELLVIDQVRKKRIELGISQAELAFQLGVSNGFIGQVESNEFPTKYNLNHLEKLSKILNCTISEFFISTNL